MLANETQATTGNSTINHYPVRQARMAKPAQPTPLKLRSDKADELQAIRGIGPVIEKALHAAGIYHYRQIARFDTANITWVNQHLDFHGRIEREDWIGQAQRLLPKEDSAETTDSMQPALLDKPLNSGPDNLKRIKGIGLVLEKDLQEIGIYHYQQLATLSNDNTKWLNQKLGFPGRIERENWAMQARELMTGNTTEYSARFDQGKTPYAG